MIAFYHEKGIDRLKLGCTLPNRANICLHKSTDANFYPMTEGYKDFLEKIEKMFLVVHQSFLHEKLLLMKLFFENQQNFASLLLGLTLANYTHTRCVKPRLTGHYTRWDLDSEIGGFTPGQNKIRGFENVVISCFLRTRPECKIENFFTTGRQKKIDCFRVNGFCSHCNTVFEAMGCFYHFCPVNSCVQLSLKKTFSVQARRDSWMH